MKECKCQICKKCISQDIEFLKKHITDHPTDIKIEEFGRILTKLNKRYKFYKDLYIIDGKDYIIDRKIGSGTDGVIYIAKGEDDKDYIIKF